MERAHVDFFRHVIHDFAQGDFVSGSADPFFRVIGGVQFTRYFPDNLPCLQIFQDIADNELHIDARGTGHTVPGNTGQVNGYDFACQDVVCTSTFLSELDRIRLLKPARQGLINSAIQA